MNRKGILVVLLAAAVAASGCTKDTVLPSELLLSSSNLDFGLVPVGAEGSELLAASNAGDGQIEVLSVQLIEGDDEVWDISREGSLLLADDLTLDVTVTFTPEDEQQYLGRIQLRYDDGESGSVLVDLLGEGAPSQADDDGDGWQVDEGDCDDDDPTVYPGADELCDGQDNDCDGATPADEADDDGDRWRVCEGDCDDADANVHPEAEEICDEGEPKDSDCDGEITDNADVDGDGYSICDGDCNDDAPDANPGLPEACDGLDSDCNGVVDDIDTDGDGHSICSQAGDCDDDDANAYPVVVDPSYGETDSDGTDARPYRTLDDGLNNLDGDCDTVWLADAEYSLSLSLGSSDALTLVGQSMDGVVLTPDDGRHFELSSGAALTLSTLSVTGANTSGDGGALRAVGASLHLEDVRFEGNVCSGDGGALSASSSDVTVDGAWFVGNEAVDDGGAVALLSATLTDRGSLYEDNVAVRGGALVSDSSEVDVQGVWFQGNQASDRGGAAAVIGGSGLTMVGNTFALNSAVLEGGALSFTDVSPSGGSVRNNRIQENNGGQQGGGVAIGGSSSSFELCNNTLVGNLASQQGAGLALSASGAMVLCGNLLVGSDGGGSGLYVASEASHSVRYNSVYGTISGTNYEGISYDGVDGNDQLNPTLQSFSADRDPGNDDLSLRSGSPAINSGPPESNYNDRDGSRNDRGTTGGPYAG